MTFYSAQTKNEPNIFQKSQIVSFENHQAHPIFIVYFLVLGFFRSNTSSINP